MDDLAAMNAGFWRDKRVFLTGHTGFKGSWLSLVLERAGARVRGYALEPPTEPSLFERAGVQDVVESVIGDIRDANGLADAIGSFAPDVVLHLAAQSVVLTSYQDPLETFSSNVLGTANVLEAVRRMGRSCTVVNVTTDKVYENRAWVWGYRETDRLGGRDPYSASKACAEFVARSFRDSYFSTPAPGGAQVGLANARAGNVIGGGDWTPRQLIPEVLQSFAAGRPVELRHPAAIRPWQHVLDCLDGYLKLAEALAADPARFADDWNFGPDDDDMLPVSTLVEILADRWGAAAAWVRDPGEYPHEAMELRLNSQKANRLLSWRPRLPLPEALAWTADWYQRHAAGEPARGLCLEQIERRFGTA